MNDYKSSWLQKLLREPLLQFLAVGALLFGLHAAFFAAPADDGRTLLIHSGVVNVLRTRLALENGREPSAQEVAAAIDSYVEEELLYRHALQLGLDKGDPIVRRRLVQAARLLVENSTLIEAPDEGTLRTYYEENLQQFLQPGRVSFRHVYLPASERDSADPDCAAIGVALSNGADPAALGRPFLLGLQQRDKTVADLAHLFGEAFAASVMALPLDRWNGPLDSRYGCHHVRISARTEAIVPPFEIVAEKVARDWRAQETNRLNELAIAALKARFDVRVEGEKFAAPGDNVQQ